MWYDNYQSNTSSIQLKHWCNQYTTHDISYDDFEKTFKSMLSTGADPHYESDTVIDFLIEQDFGELLTFTLETYTKLFDYTRYAKLLQKVMVAGMTEIVPVILSSAKFRTESLISVTITSIEKDAPFPCIEAIFRYDKQIIHSPKLLSYLAITGRKGILVFLITEGADPHTLDAFELRTFFSKCPQPMPAGVMLRKGLIPPPDSMPFSLFLSALKLPDTLTPMDYINSPEFDDKYADFCLSCMK